MPEHGREYPDKANHPARQVGRAAVRWPKNHEDYAEESHDRHYADYMADVEEPYPEAHIDAHNYAEAKVREEIDWDNGPGRWDTDPRV